MKCYIITEENLNEYTSTIICVYTDKNKAKRKADELNGRLSEDDQLEYRIQSFEMDAEESYD